MQTGTREYLGRNKFWTPSNIAITQSIVDSSIANISLNDSNSSELFSVTSDNSAIQTNGNVPLQASQFIITGTNEEIDEDENNAVNKRYLVDKITPLDSKFMTQAQCDERYYTKNTVDEKLGVKVNNDYLTENYYDKNTVDEKYYDKDTVDAKLAGKADKDTTAITLDTVTTKKLILENNGGLNDEIYLTSFASHDTGNLIPFIAINGLYSSLYRTLFNSPVTLTKNSGVEFNANQLGEKDEALYPTTKLVNLVTSEITTAEMDNILDNNISDNVCPTYNYLTTNYYKKTEIDTTFNNYYTKTQIDIKINSWQVKNLTSYITDNENNIPFSSNEILLYEVELPASNSDNPFYIKAGMCTFTVIFYFDTTAADSTLMQKINKFILKFDDGASIFNGWMSSENRGFAVHIDYVFSGRFPPKKFSLSFEPKNIDSTFSNKFTLVEARIEYKKI